MAKLTDIPLKYDPSTGIFIWTKNVARSKKKGSIAGSLWKNGYVCIKYKNKIYKAHRLAFLLMTGSMPKNTVDHINRNRSDNRWENLRDVTHKENMRNQKKRCTNTSGVTGVYETKYGKFRVTVSSTYIGSYKTLEEATLARMQANIDNNYTLTHGV